MTTKPTDNGRFAQTAGGTDATNISAPSGGDRDAGFSNSEVLTSGNLNYLENIGYKWRKWLDDGDCAFHNLSASGTLQATGLTTLSGGLTVPTGQAVALSGTTTLTTGTGAVSIGGAQTNTGLITANAGMTAGSNQNVTVSGTGQLKHGTRTLPVSFLHFVVGAGASGPVTYNIGTGLATQTGVSQQWLCPILLPAGKRILALRVFLKDSATGPTELVANLAKLAMSTGVSTGIALTGTAASNTSGNYQTLTLTVTTPTAVVAGNPYYLQCSAVTGSALTGFGGVDVDYDEP